MFTRSHLDRIEQITQDACADFGAELAECHGDSNHVHVLVHFPPTWRPPASPDPNTIGVVAGYPAAGCGKPRCEPLWTGINFTSGFASPPSVANGVVFVGKGPATATPQNTPDAGLYAFKAAGCGAAICNPISFLELSTDQNYLGAPLAVAGGEVFMASTDNISGRTLVYAIGLSG